MAVRTHFHLLAVAAIAFVVGACGRDDQPAPPATEPPGTDEGQAPIGVWLLRSAESDEGPIDVPPDVKVTLEFDGETVGGTNGCNDYGAEVAVYGGGAIEIGPIELTTEGCEGPRGDIERAFMDALAAAERIDLDGQTLTLRSTGSTWIFDRGTPDDSARVTPDPIALDGQWLVVGLTVDGVAAELLPDRPVTVHLDGDRVTGTAACNDYGGTVAIEASEDGRHGSFVVGELSWTEMGCEPVVMEVEEAFLQALQLVDSFSASPDGVQLDTETSETFIDLEPVEPVREAELAGTTWVLDAYLSGDVASNVPGMDSAFLEFAGDGTLAGSTGCRRLEGEWQLRGATLLIPVLSAIDDPTAGACAPEHEQLDGLVIGVVESGVAVEIDGRRLTLTAPGGDGLSYRAAD